MKTKLDYLKQMGLEDILPQTIVDKIKIETYKKGDMIEMEAFHQGKSWKILEGVVKVTLYMGHGKEYFAEFKEDEWIGVASNLLAVNVTVDIEAKTDTKLLSIPIKEMIEKHPDAMIHLWEKIARGSAMEFIRFLGGSMAKAVLTNEGYFLNYLSQNDREIKFGNTKELSELLNTNLRTLQRIIRKLKEEGIIEKTKNKIWVIDEAAFEGALEEQLEVM